MVKSVPLAVWLFAALAASLPGAPALAAPQARFPSYLEGDSFTARYEALEAHRVRGKNDGEVILGREISWEADVVWEVEAAAEHRAQLSGRIIRGTALVRDRITGAGLPRELEMELDGLELGLRIADVSAQAELNPQGWANVAVRARSGPPAERLSPTVLGAARERAAAFLRDALEIPFKVALQGDEIYLPVRLELPLFSPDGELGGQVVIEPWQREVIGGPHARELQVPLHAQLTTQPRLDWTRWTTLRQPLRSRARLPKAETFGLGDVGYLRWVRRKDGRALGRLECSTLATFEADEVLGSIARVLAPHDQEHELLLRYTPVLPEGSEERVVIDRHPLRLPFRDRLRKQAPALDRRLDALARKPQTLDRELEAYRRMERKAGRRSARRALFHYCLAEELAVLAYREDVAPVKERLRTVLAEEQDLALVVLALRAAAHPYGLLTDAQRLELLELVASRPEPELAGWGIRFLTHVSWEGALRVLERVGGLKVGAAQNAVPRPGSREALLRLAQTRLFGPHVEKPWLQKAVELEASGVGVTPYAFSYQVSRRPGGGDHRTLSSFLKPLSLARVVFVLDASAAMGKPLEAAGPLVAGRAIGAAAFLEGLTRLDWARAEIGFALDDVDDLHAEILALRQNVLPWQGALSSVEGEGENAAAFLARLRAAGTARLGPALPPIFAAAGPAAVVLLASEPLEEFRAAGEIELQFALWNYLRGAAVISIGFAPPRTETPGLLERLARRNWGWYGGVLRR